MIIDPNLAEFYAAVPADSFDCGACAETFFTGGTFHKHTCTHEIVLISVSHGVHSPSQPKEP